MWDTRRRVLEIKSLKQGVIQDKGVNMMLTVFRMDVSKASSEVAILVNGEKVHGYTMPNDAIGFSRLLEDLK
ncbi:degenerate transposase [Streptococcus pneumoniae]|nr:degenerate transposase [Streptococcus pneumoniae]